jgi:hypothetical protein
MSILIQNIAFQSESLGNTAEAVIDAVSIDK